MNHNLRYGDSPVFVVPKSDCCLRRGIPKTAIQALCWRCRSNLMSAWVSPPIHGVWVLTCVGSKPSSSRVGIPYLMSWSSPIGERALSMVCNVILGLGGGGAPSDETTLWKWGKLFGLPPHLAKICSKEYKVCEQLLTTRTPNWWHIWVMWVSRSLPYGSGSVSKDKWVVFHSIRNNNNWKIENRKQVFRNQF